MRKLAGISAIALFFLAPRGARAGQQGQSSQQAKSPASSSQSRTDPLVEAARKAREEQKTAPKTPVVFTNDNIPRSPGAVSVIGTTTPPPAAKGAAAAPGTPASSAKAKPGSKGQAYWRSLFAGARQKLAQDRQALAIEQRELSQLQVQYYPNPQQALMQQYNRGDITKKQNAIAKTQKEIEADQQAISNLEDQLRRAGGDPGWARE